MVTALDEDSARFYPPERYPQDAKRQIAAAHAAHEAALIPASRTEIHAALVKLSTGTNLRREHEGETRLSMELLIEGLNDVPVDILNAAVDAFMRQPGSRKQGHARFFPRSAGELRAFTNVAMFDRSRRAARLAAMMRDITQREAEEADRRRADTSWTLEAVDEANRDFRRVGLKTRYRYLGDGRVEHFKLGMGQPDPA